MLVYKASFPNGKCYVGLTVDKLCNRQRTHKHFALKRNSQLYFHRAIRKYGWENIIWETLAHAESFEVLKQLEIEFISKLNSFAPNGYNLTRGGQGTVGSSHNLGKKRTPEQLAKHRADRRQYGKTTFIVDPLTKNVMIFDTVGEASRQLNLNYAYLKVCRRRNGRCGKYFVFESKEKMNLRISKGDLWLDT